MIDLPILQAAKADLATSLLDAPHGVSLAIIHLHGASLAIIHLHGASLAKFHRMASAVQKNHEHDRRENFRRDP
jgi:hypothetical protein